MTERAGVLDVEPLAEAGFVEEVMAARFASVIERLEADGADIVELLQLQFGC